MLIYLVLFADSCELILVDVLLSLFAICGDSKSKKDIIIIIIMIIIIMVIKNINFNICLDAHTHPCARVV